LSSGPPADPTPEGQTELQPLRDAAPQTFGLDGALLEVVADPQAYVQSAHDLVLAGDSTARRVAQAPFEEVPFCLSFKCDGCLYNEWCMKWPAGREDLSRLPYMTGTEKEAGPLLPFMHVAQHSGRHADDQHGQVALRLVPHPREGRRRPRPRAARPPRRRVPAPPAQDHVVGLVGPLAVVRPGALYLDEVGLSGRPSVSSARGEPLEVRDDVAVVAAGQVLPDVEFDSLVE
jgi:hypothetical protein